MVVRLVDWSEARRRFCVLRVERRTVRLEVVVDGREGWVEDVRCDWKLKWDVVGSVKGNGMVKVSHGPTSIVDRGYHCVKWE